jgi:Phage integrase central domain
VARLKIPYYSVRRNGRRGFWEPRPHMRALGFYSVPCGQDGPDAWAIAEEWNRRWQAVKRGETPSPAMAAAENLSPGRAEELTIYPPRALGEAFRRYRRTQEWSSKAARTREDWWRGWKRIKPVFGDVDVRTVTLEDISAWRKTIEETISLREAHRCLKIWRAMWKVAAALGYCVRDADPSLGVRNRAPPGRARPGLKAKLCGSTSAPTATVTMGWVRLSRSHGTPIGGALSDRALAALEAYIAGLGAELHGEAYIFRNRSGAPYSSDTLGDDFRDIRARVFGARDKRTLADFRRSGAVEAIAGGARAEELAHAMGNTLSASNALYATYVPVNLATIRGVMDARRRGRTKLR